MEIKYTLSKADGGATRFLERDGYMVSCPYHTCYDEKNKPSNANCGDWCSMFDTVEFCIDEGKALLKVQLHCGSGNAEYQIET